MRRWNLTGMVDERRAAKSREGQVAGVRPRHT